MDKTGHIRRLLDEGKHYFLSRPRRFGKSLFLDTCKELFEGNETLFEGLAIHGHWDWSIRRPVLRLSFGSGHFKEPDYLHTNLMAQLDAVERQASVSSAYTTGPERFGHLLEALHGETGRRVAVLVDKYDKPILDALDRPEIARANRDYLRGLYAVIKDSDARIRFSFITGVSKFSKVSLFSGLNNLTDITIEPEYSSICGYTDQDLDTVFAPELPGLDRDEIRDWYNGYGWLGEENLGGNVLYRLGYPNREVRQSLNERLLRYLVRDASRQTANSIRLYRLLEANDFSGLATLFQAFFASIPYEWYTNNDIASYEGYYASVFYSYFAGLGLDVTVEDSTSHGRLDMALRFGGNVYLFEFKVVEMAPEGAAMAQLKEKRYADKYRGSGQPVYLIAVEFSKDARNVVAFEMERA